MLLMNDGELAHRLTHPSYGVLKTYLADVPGPVSRDTGRRLLSGIELADGVASADKFRVIEQGWPRALVEITLHEGRKHIVRRMLAEAGHPVQPAGPHPRRPGRAGLAAAGHQPRAHHPGNRRAVFRSWTLTRPGTLTQLDSDLLWKDRAWQLAELTA